ncbi:hypothetical protein [Granulicoccus phenolivorans]|uniref:hypothetical protein n=1 Tax=Granulicoccus phenolivorans TaxID=266854 RepID=UPI00041C0577|nr:hypothetical protein [Granulicoccus phenolivorans]
MTDLTELRLRVRATRSAREAARRALRDVEARASSWRTPDGVWTEVDQALNRELFARIEQLKQELPACTQTEDEARRAHEDAVAAYDEAARAAPQVAGDEPLLLLPLRVEALYAERNAAPVLQVRVYPDDIHVDSHEEALTAGEEAAGRAYWQSVHAAGGDPVLREAAWRDLVRACTGARAAWVARVLTPGNTPPAPPEFPVVARRDAAWTRAAETTLLPDHLDVSAYRDGALIWRLSGAQIPHPLPLGMAPAPDDPPAGEEDTVQFDPASRWLIDFDAAVACGMAVVAPLTDPAETFDLLTVVGVSTADAATGAARVQQMLTAHAYLDGLAALPQGTPTNNTPGSRSGWRSRTAPPDPATAAARTAAYRADGDQDAARLARALGVDGREVLATVFEAESGDAALLRRLHRLEANWFSWSRAFRPLTDDRAAPAPIDEPWFAPVAAHFSEQVRARGPLPVLRVGRQPYGPIPVSTIDLWRGDDLPTGMADVVTSLLTEFELALPGALRVGEGVDQDAVLLDLLGRDGSPGRLVTGFDVNQRDLNQGPPPAAFGALPADRRLAWQSVDTGPGPDEPGGDPSRRIEEFPATVPEEVRALLAERPLTQLLVLFDEALQTMRDTGIAPRADAFAARYAPLARRLAQVLAAPTQSVFYQQAEWAYNALNNICSAGPVPAAEIAARVVEGARFRALLARYVALEDTAAADLPRLERLLREVLQTLASRIDAWVTSLATARLTAIRAQTPDGIRVGGYGWLTAIDPSTPNAPAEGFILTPSLHHATTAAVLRSGWQAHSDGEAFAVDIQSTRVRRAQAMLDGVREGQTVSALLGYQFERALHDARLDRFIAGFRASYPLAPLVEPDTADAAGARIAIGARNVVDGQALRSDPRLRTDDAALAAAAGAALDEDAARLRRLLGELDETFDAVGDLLLAESVHQLVGGNPVRAGLAADALGRGLALPTEFDVLATPRGGVAATHHVAVGFPAAPGPGWTDDRPLAVLDPGLEGWVRDRLGPAESWPFGAAFAGWCALDVLAASPERLRAVAGAVPPDGALEDFVLLCDGLRATLAGATPLLPVHFDAATSSPAAGVDLTDLHARVVPWLAAVRAARAELGDAATVATALTRLDALGVPAGDDPGAGARVRAHLAAAVLEDPGVPPDPATGPAEAAAWLTTTLRQVGQLVPPWLVVAPVLTAVPGAPDPVPGPDEIAAWRRDLGQVRPRLDRLDQVMLASELLAGRAPAPDTVRQVPGAGGTGPWIATAGVDALGRGPSAVLLTGALEGRPAGVVIDSWTEVIGRGPTPPPAAPADAVEAVEAVEEVAGLAFEFDRPGARPPQALLIAVPPDRSRGWCLEDVHACVEDTLTLAQVRTLDLADLPSLRGVLPLPDGQG